MSSAEKLRGAYFTPEPVARFLAAWAITEPATAFGPRRPATAFGPRRPAARVLEPSAGAGAFVQAVSPLLSAPGRVDAVESFADDAQRLSALGLANVRVVADDVFSWWSGERSTAFRPRRPYDAVVGNPPFIRYQAFNGERRNRAFALMHEAGLQPSRLTNAWVPFVVLAVRALRPGGRVALVVPSELVSVGYAGPLRDWLVRELSTLRLITFRRLVFGKAEQGTVLLLGERGPGPADVAVAEVNGPADLDGEMRWKPAACPPGRAKWTRLWLTPRQRGLLDEIERSGAFPRLGTVAEVDVGIVTGANAFFVLRPSQARQHGLDDWCVPLVGRSAQLPVGRLDRAGWEALAGADERCLLLQLGDTLPPAGAAYVAEGEKAGVHTGYKCRIRMPAWWRVPSVWAPDAFLLRQIHAAPRMVVNEAGVVCTDTIHRVRARSGVDPGWLATATDHPLTWAFAEVLGRSYGGGVLELEPTEAEALPVVPAGGGGLTDSEVECLRGIWQDLSERRRPRRK